MSFVKTLPKNITLDDLTTSICLLLNRVYSLPVNNKFIKRLIDKHFIVDSFNNIVIKTEVKELYITNTSFLKEFLGISFESLVDLALIHKPQDETFKLTLVTKIKLLENEISSLKETIEEMRESYIRVKRDLDYFKSK